MANPPPVAANGKSRASFRCPLHIENDLKILNNPLLGALTGQRIHKIRRPRDARIVRPDVERGNRNNGIIEVEDADEVLCEQEDGVVYGLSAKSVLLDFIAKGRRRV
jgi:hypothetical protein